MDPWIQESRQATYTIELNAGEYLFKNGAPANGVYYISSGRMELIYRTEEGFFSTEIKSAGEIIGEDNVDINYYVFDALALEDTQVCFIEKSFFHPSENN